MALHLAARGIQPHLWVLCEQKVGDSEAPSGHLCPSMSQLWLSMFDDRYLLCKLPNELQDCYQAPKQYYHKYYKLNWATSAKSNT